METMTFYSIESDSHTWGYTVFLPIKIVEKSNWTTFFGWIIYNNDGRQSINSIFGYERFVKDDVSIEKVQYRYEDINENVKKEMLIDLFEYKRDI